MLRGRPAPENPSASALPDRASGSSAQSGFPGPESPYATDERPVGVLFYHGRDQSFFLPYHLLQTLRYQPDTLTLLFATDEVRIFGRGLHELYVQLAAQRISRVVEQGERYAAISEAATFVSRIERIPRGKRSQEPPDDSDER